MFYRSGCCCRLPHSSLYARLPVDGHYFWDLFPAFLLSGIGMAFAFIPMTIGALAGVRDSEAGIASGLINTTQQIGGAIGVAAATTIAATYTRHYLDAHPVATGGVALTHGFHDRLLRTRGGRGGRGRDLRAGHRVEAGARPRRTSLPEEVAFEAAA